jgi:hypothetical protein
VLVKQEILEDRVVVLQVGVIVKLLEQVILPQ